MLDRYTNTPRPPQLRCTSPECAEAGWREGETGFEPALSSLKARGPSPVRRLSHSGPEGIRTLILRADNATAFPCRTQDPVREEIKVVTRVAHSQETDPVGFEPTLMPG